MIIQFLPSIKTSTLHVDVIQKKIAFKDLCKKSLCSDFVIFLSDFFMIFSFSISSQ